MIENYIITWRGEFTYQEVKDDEGYLDLEEIYAIAWQPPKLKSRTEYIGMAYSQYIGERLKSNHEADNLIFEKHGEKNVRYYLGEIVLESNQRRSKQRLQDVEASMIYFHSNVVDILTANIQSTGSYSGRDLEIVNQGIIPPEISDFQVIDYEFGFI